MGEFREHWKIAFALALLTVIAAARIASTYRVFSATFDEPAHISTGVEIYQEHQYRRNLENPPLARWAVGILPYLNGVRVGPSPTYGDDRQVDLGRQDEYWINLSLARAGNLVFLPLLVVVVYVWAARLYGKYAGLAAAGVATFSPNVLAHADLATADFAAAATLAAAGYALHCSIAEPRPRNVIVSAALSGFAAGAKFSAIAILPIFAGAAFLILHGRRLPDKGYWNIGDVKRLVRSAVLFLFIAGGALWAIYGFEVRPLRNATDRPYERVDTVLTPGTALNRIAYAALETPLPLAGFIEGFLKIQGFLDAGFSGFTGGVHRQFLLGEIDEEKGWWYYFPVAFALKSTLPFLLILALAAAGLAAGAKPRIRPEEICLISFLALIFLVSMFSSLNIGIRHILAAYPLAAIFASSVFARSGGAFLRRRGVVIAGGILLLGHCAVSLRAHPDYLAYFNEYARGREHLYLADSNLDWGQDVARLARHVNEHQIGTLHVALVTSSPLDSVGLESAIPFSAGERPSGWIAISVSYLQQLLNTGENDFLWLLDHEPRAKIGSSIWLYYIER